MNERELRRLELEALLLSGSDEFDWLFLECFPPGVVPPVGVLMIETILDHEFP